MKLVLLSLFDEKVGAYMTPFFAQSVGAGVRSVADLVNGGGQEPPAKHPDDFKLYAMGEFDDAGVLTPVTPPQLVASCLNLRAEVMK